jgi:hypothetical protein
MPGFEKANLFSEQPIIAVLETEGATRNNPDGSRTIGSADFKIVSFANMSDATEFRKQKENPDKAPTTVQIYAFSAGEWKLVKAVAEPN